MIQGEALKYISEMEKRMMGFITAMSYNFCQLCVKADPSSLLTAEMTVQGDTKHIEDLALVIIHNKKEDGDDKSMDLYPKDPEYLAVIMQGMMSVHPEFKQSIETKEDALDKDDIKYKYLRLTVPDVDKDRHDLIINTIDALHEVCKANLERMYGKCTAQLTPVMVGYTKEQIDEVNDSKDKYRDTYKKMMQDCVDQKKQEVEDAYKEYQEQHANDESASSDGSSSSQVGQSIKV